MNALCTYMYIIVLGICRKITFTLNLFFIHFYIDTTKYVFKIFKLIYFLFIFTML